MCGTCGCGQSDDHVTIIKHGEEHHHEHNHEFEHDHDHQHDDEKHSHSHDHKLKHSHSHDDHKHTHESEHDKHSHSHSHSHEVKIEQDIMNKNDKLAERNRGYFEAKNIFTLNLVSSPGSGKTSLLERTINELKKEINFSVIEGDQQTMNDADRINATGAPVV